MAYQEIIRYRRQMKLRSNTHGCELTSNRITKYKLFFIHAINCYVSSIFLYNSELWTLTKTKEKLIDSFHRKILRTACVNIRWPKKLSNNKFYEITGVKPWSYTIKIRQLK